MRKQTAILLIVLSVVVTVFTMEVLGQEKKLSEGMEPYIPTKLEWLMVEMISQYGANYLDLWGFTIWFSGYNNDNTINIRLQQTPSVNRELMNFSVKNAREVINGAAKMRGWDSWLKIKEQYL